MANSKFLDKHNTIFTDTFKMEYGNARVTKETKRKNTPFPTTQRTNSKKYVVQESLKRLKFYNQRLRIPNHPRKERKWAKPLHNVSFCEFLSGFG